MFYMYRDWRCGIETGLFVRATDVTKEHSAAQVTCYDIAANARGPSRVNVYIYIPTSTVGVPLLLCVGTGYETIQVTTFTVPLLDLMVVKLSSSLSL